MISSLRIENFTLIDSANIQFDGGFTVITGETGSGKSILLNALNLILGERANLSTIGNRGNQAVVEAEIDISKFGMKEFFDENELEYYENTIIRRQVNKEGRSRAFINDTPVQLSVLKEFSSQLVRIHSQYNTLELKRPEFQLKVLDVLADTLQLRNDFSARRREYMETKLELDRLRSRLSDSISKEDYNSFQLDELKSLDLQNVDYQELTVELSRNENAEDVKETLDAISQTLSSDGGVDDLLGRLITILSKRGSLDERLEGLLKQIESARIELADVASQSEQIADDFESDPRKLDEIIARLDTYNRICQKHGVSDQEALIGLMNDLSNSSMNHEELKERITVLEQQCESQLIEIHSKAKVLHDKRSLAIPNVERAITLLLNDLKLENTALSFKLSENELNEYGCSKLDILFSPNPGVPVVPIHQAASGGELSRVMLALQSLMASHLQLQTILFDEIDTGVSGDVAQKMANTFRKMGEHMQVIAITHLPQVAAKGSQHLRVIKSVDNGITTASVIELNPEERVEETARLMSGDQISEAALENAKLLMK